MCGRIHIPGETQFLREFDLPDELRLGYEESFNFAATQKTPVLRVVRGTPGKREAVLMRWGLVPFFANGVPPKYSTINARAETIDTSAAFRGCWQRGQRCIIPAAGFYEWHTQDDGQRWPYYIRPTGDDDLFAIAGLWDRSVSAVGEETLSCTVITLAANKLLARIHNDKQRMPAIIDRADIETWLSGSTQDARTLLKPYPSERMVAWPVSKSVNTPKNNNPDLIRPVDVDVPKAAEG
jgi:putative SOS response-associated peptidase YedK